MTNEMPEEEYLELFSNAAPKIKAPAAVNNTENVIEDDSDKDATVRKHISIKVRQSDLDSLKKEAEKRGLRYQSLINSILHQYVTGRLRPV
jgi:predicted DNA binding CopG/RHH family protein